MADDTDIIRCLPAGMLAPGIPDDESARLEALHRLNVLDTPPEERFDVITRLVAKALDVPMALVSLVDSDRQWFKSRVGLDATETPRNISFCGHAIFERRTLVVPDATRDPRFAGNPLVLGPPFVRAYAGVPVFTLDRQPIGTLCIIDVVPRDFTPAQIVTISEFSAFLTEIIHARELSARARAVLNYTAERENLFRDGFDCAAVGLIHTSVSGRIQRMNKRACDILGVARHELAGSSFIDCLQPREKAKNSTLLNKVSAGLMADYRLKTKIRTRVGLDQAVVLSVGAKMSADGHPEYLIVALEEVSARRRAKQNSAPAEDVAVAARSTYTMP